MIDVAAPAAAGVDDRFRPRARSADAASTSAGVATATARNDVLVTDLSPADSRLAPYRDHVELL